jgi:hypothetical protein
MVVVNFFVLIYLVICIASLSAVFYFVLTKINSWVDYKIARMKQARHVDREQMIAKDKHEL